MTRLGFVLGSLEVHDAPADLASPHLEKDPRAGCLRGYAARYADVVRALRAMNVPYEDLARKYGELAEGARVTRVPRPYQEEALRAWSSARGRGVVVLPTGAGKTHVAVMAISEKRRDTLVVAPTLELVRQWYDLLRTTFGTEVGVVGGGEHTVLPITVTTYDSAHLHMQHLGARFGLVVFDECHHLPSGAFAHAAQASIAPYRLGLTATPERADGLHHALDSLIGPVVYRKDIGALSGEYLAPYVLEHIEVELTDDERRDYDEARAEYVAFVRAEKIRLGTPAGWRDFILRAARSDVGRRAFRAYRTQRALAFSASAKFEMVDHLLFVHRSDRVLLFTEDNRAAYAISERFLVPAITHQTKVRERSEILSRFSDGTYGAIVTSKVLNEGVDVPEANVAIVLSGSGSVREHVQRLGRILRKKAGGGAAILYEIVTKKTAEGYVSERRRDHAAYRPC